MVPDVHGNGNVGNSLFRPEHIDRLIAVAASQLDPVRNENLSGGKGGAKLLATITIGYGCPNTNGVYTSRGKRSVLVGSDFRVHWFYSN